MARIPEAEIDRIKQEVSVERLLGLLRESGYELFNGSVVIPVRS